MTICTRLFSLFVAGVLISPGSLQAQPSSSSIVDGVEGTDETSYLFWTRIDLKRTRQSDERLGKSWSEVSRLPPAVQPMPDSFGRLFRAITQKKADKPRHVVSEGKSPLSIILEPAQFELKHRREITVTLIFTNESDRQIRLTFPTTQRIDLLLKDKTGAIIEKWSDYHSFDPLEEVVAVNPHETIAYSQRFPTRNMKRLETYTLDASFSSQPQYKQSIPICPQ